MTELISKFQTFHDFLRAIHNIRFELNLTTFNYIQKFELSGKNCRFFICDHFWANFWACAIFIYSVSTLIFCEYQHRHSLNTQILILNTHRKNVLESSLLDIASTSAHMKKLKTTRKRRTVAHMYLSFPLFQNVFIYTQVTIDFFFLYFTLI